MDQGNENAIRLRMNGLIAARNHLDAKIKLMKTEKLNTKTLEKVLKSYDRDIKGYKKTLGLR